MQLSKDIDTAHSELDAQPDVDPESKAHLLKVAQRALELSPRAQTAIDDLTHTHLQDLPKNPSRQQLTEYIARSTLQLQHLTELFDLAGRAWPMPQIPQNMPPSDTIVDIFPTDPPDGPEHESLRTFREKYGITRSASELAALALMEHVDKGMTALELSYLIYSDIEEYRQNVAADGKNPDHYARSRVHMLMSPSSGLVEKHLFENNYKLQYGWRMTVDGNGEQVGRKTRLFRATEYSEETPTAFIERVPSTEAARISLLPESETEKRSEEDECMMVVERLVARLHTHNLLPAQSDQLVNPIQVKLQLLGFKKQHPELISEKGDLFNLFSWVRKAPHGMHVNLRTLLSATIGDTFGKRLPDRQQRRVLQQIDVALANHYGEAEDIA